MTAKPSSKPLLWISVATGLIAMLLLLTMVKSQPTTATTPKRNIVVARRDLPPGIRLDAQRDLTELAVSSDIPELIERSIPGERRTALHGQVITRGVPGGTPVWYSDLTATRSLELTTGKLALSIPVKGGQGVVSLLDPGDRVRLLVTRSTSKSAAKPAAPTQPEEVLPMLMGNLPQPGEGEWRTEVVSDDSFKVIAVGRRTASLRHQPIVGGDIDRAGLDQVQSITLEVTQAQAQTILERSGAGQLPLTLLLVANDADPVASSR